MKSVKQIPITHPKHGFLDTQLEECNKALSLVSHMISLFSAEDAFNGVSWKVPIPVRSSNMKSWQTIVYELSSMEDYEEACSKYEESCQIVRGGEWLSK